MTLTPVTTGTNTNMKYRIIDLGESFDIVTEKGGVASFYHNGENYVTTYFQKGLNDCSTPDKIKFQLWDEMAEGKVYFKDWDSSPLREQVIQDALNWLVFPQPPEWQEDDNLYTDFFPHS